MGPVRIGACLVADGVKGCFDVGGRGGHGDSWFADFTHIGDNVIWLNRLEKKNGPVGEVWRYEIQR